jgi:N6-adenosine-specific RNA methylase IME4
VDQDDARRQADRCERSEAEGIVEAYEIREPKVPRGEHSRKPAIVRNKIVELLGDRSRVELFARGAVPDGWNSWGDQAA